MADTMQFDLVSPERKLASAEASSATMPGIEGDFGVQPGHAPFLTTLRPGVVSVVSGSGTDEYFVTGGFAEVSPQSLTILAEGAMPRADVTSETMASLLSDAEAALETASDDAKTAAALRVNDVKTLTQVLGL